MSLIKWFRCKFGACEPKVEIEEVYPCRCGTTHTGPYAIYDYGHHNCYHDSSLVPLSEQYDEDQWMCPDCGKVFNLDRERIEIGETQKP